MSLRFRCLCSSGVGRHVLSPLTSVGDPGRAPVRASSLGAGLSQDSPWDETWTIGLDALDVALPNCSFSFVLYLSFSLNALSRSLLSPKIMPRCLSTSLHNCAFCAVNDCLSFSIYRINSSAEPAACIRDCISAEDVPVTLDSRLFAELDCE